MGELLKSFVYPRNSFGKTAQASAEGALQVIQRVETSTLRTDANGAFKDESFNDSRQFLAIVAGPPNDPHVTSVGERYRLLAETSELGAWRWLLTRSMWLYSVPNGSQAQVNRRAGAAGITFNFFDIVTRLVVHLSAMPAPNNTLYFDELLPVLDDDSNWALDSPDLFALILREREATGVKDPNDHAELLMGLEPQFGVPRDNLNTAFRKGFGQCGLFALHGDGHRALGIKLDPAAYSNRVLAERLRFVLDHPQRFKA